MKTRIMDSSNWKEQRREERQRWREERWKMRQEIREHYHNSGSGRIWIGVLLLIIGIAALMKLQFFPEIAWLYDWPVILIILGLFIGARHNFRGGAWFIM